MNRLKPFNTISLAVILSLGLTACGSDEPVSSPGGPGGSGTSDSQASSGSVEPKTADLADNNVLSPLTIAVTSAEQNQAKSLICNQADGTTACGLITYQIMVEAFINGDETIGYGTAYGSSHHQGDIQGVIDSLDYIKSLGVNSIWLTPIFNSDGFDKLDATGYFARDYFNIDPKFGSMETVKTLVEQAHAKGLYVFFDGVFGHYKNKISSSPTGKLPVNGSCVNSSGDSYNAGSGTACADYNQQATLDYFTEVATYWINEVKIDGWRLDQAYQVPVDKWADIRASVKQASQNVTYLNNNGDEVNPLGYMVAEVWSGESKIKTSAYGSDSSPALTSAFDFPLRYKLVQTLAVEESGKIQDKATNLAAGFYTHNSYPTHAMPNLMLTNHDLVRFGDLLQRAELSDPTLDSYWQRHKSAFSFMAAYSGPITLYYGDEIGDEVVNFASRIDCGADNGVGANVGHCDDHVSRNSGKIEGLSGDFTLSSNQSDLKDYVSQLMTVRKANPALYNGSRTHIYSDDALYIDKKVAGNNKVLYLLNVKNKQLDVTLSTTAAGTDSKLTDLLAGTEYTESNGEYTGQSH